MGTTPNLAIPYIEPTDLLANYPTQDKAQADRLEVLLYDTGWVAVTISAGFAADAGGPPQVRRIGKIIYCRGGWNATGVGATGDFNVGTIPDGWRPTSVGVMCAIAGSAGPSPGRFDFAVSGVIRMRVTTAAGYYKLVGYSWTTD